MLSLLLSVTSLTGTVRKHHSKTVGRRILSCDYKQEFENDMCGITGWVAYGQDMEHQRDILQRMTDTMALRGPDGQGIWIDGPVGLGHRRLSVIDLEGGSQPMMVKLDGEREVVTITYSGEVYNFQELRAELQSRGHHFNTRSDTEVVLRAYVE
ncbi:MAG: nucleophile aminohydrolase [Linnemannia gamsii]|nr:MAG: nucleophile aminohydrolase [Linnemannia gamsii]